MCGIAGIMGADLPEEALALALERMGNVLAHRGPDDSATLVVPSMRSGLSCRRLSIIDLAEGRQPMPNEDTSVYAALNGEIYNHRELRSTLEERGHRFRSHCDTEVIVHLYEEFGTGFLDRLHGMFGLAVLDTRSRSLLLARDASGMKPLYYSATASGFLFASEAKALFASGLLRPEPDWGGLDTCLAFGYVPSPKSCFRDVERLPAGGYLTWSGGRVTPGTYWRLRFDNSLPRRADKDYAKTLSSVLEAAVTSHLAADVPVGCFLSGGWDSSLVTTLAARASSHRLKTFSIVFPEDPKTDESRFSRLIARRLGTDHHEIEFRDSDIPALLPKIAFHLDEPVTTAPAVLQFQMSSLAAREVKTVLSGEGSDELFGGYDWLRHRTYYQLRRIAPRPLIRLFRDRIDNPRLSRLLRVVSAPDEQSAHEEWLRAFTPRGKVRVTGGVFRHLDSGLAAVRPHPETLASCQDRLQRRLALEFIRRLGDGILFTSDKMSMAHSLEVRMPFLDHAVVDFALGLPSDMKIRRDREKYVLSMLGSLLPPEIAQRRKKGLGYPPMRFLRCESGAYARAMLLDSPGPFEKEVSRAVAGSGAVGISRE